MRQYHVVFASRIDVAAVRAGVAGGDRPRHFMLHVADLLGAKVWEPAPDDARPVRRNFAERLLATPPACAALAEDISRSTGPEDVVFCNSEAISLSLAARLGARPGPVLASLMHNVSRPRIAILDRLTRGLDRLDAVFAVSPLVADAMIKRLPDGRASQIHEQIDNAFFTPGASAAKHRPLIASVGLEQRDYRILAEATADLDIDVRISGFSKDARVLAETFPETTPANMTSRFYEWRDLAQLYRDADLVVVPLRANRYAAGITSVLEAAAARRPIIATASEGIAGAFADADAICWTPPGDAAALRRQIEALLADPERRAALAARSHAAFQAHHSEDLKAQEMAERLRALQPLERACPPRGAA